MAFDELTLAEHIHRLWFDSVGGEGRDPTHDEILAALAKHPDFANCDREMVERCWAMAVAEWREISRWADEQLAIEPDIEEVGVERWLDWTEARPPKQRIQ